ncbi:MAG TPA: NADH-quinone oxidoreductase subunit H, partial [Polyangiaceae bacterium]
LGGWQLPFLHRDGMTIAFGETTVFATKIPHVWMTIVGLVTFLGKTLLLCWLQAFVRWSLPRFRYDQLMKLSWRALLPASLANVFATGVLYLAIDHASPYVKGGLHVAADVTQAVVAALITFALFRMLVGLFTPTKHVRQILGTSAEATAEQGGTKVTAMQA